MPYLTARRLWTDRLLEAGRQCGAWRQAGLASLAVTGSLALSIIWGATQETIAPYVVKVAELHEPGEIWRIAPSAFLTGTTPRQYPGKLREGQTDDRALR